MKTCDDILCPGKDSYHMYLLPKKLFWRKYQTPHVMSCKLCIFTSSAIVPHLLYGAVNEVNKVARMKLFNFELIIILRTQPWYARNIWADSCL